MDRALRHASAYPHPAARIVRIETHISVIYLAGRYAYKLCKPVKLAFVDFTSLQARLRCSREALRLNRRLAPSIYLRVVPIYRCASAFRVGAFAKRPVSVGRKRAAYSEPAHPAVDYALKMRRFDPRDTLLALLERERLDVVDVDRAARRVARFHMQASRRAPGARLGSAATVRNQVLAVLASLERHAPGKLPPAVVQWCGETLEHLGAHIDARRCAGYVRECHGDLHLDNMVRLKNDIACFDCVDFDDALRWIDVAADLAFAVMDLLAHERPDLATRFLNQWLIQSGDFGALPALRLYVVYRALVRALVAALKQRAGSGRGAQAAILDRYVGLAGRLIAPPQTFLILCHGFSGSGKSVASEALAPHIGAIRISSDIERKRGAAPPFTGVAATSSLTYTPSGIDANYLRLKTTTDEILAAGFPVIVDASFLRRMHRASFMDMAAARCIPVFLLDFQAGTGLLKDRLRERRRRGAQPSDADESVLQLQQREHDPLTPEETMRTFVLHTDVPLEAFEGQAYWRDLLQGLGSCRGWLAGRGRR